MFYPPQVNPRVANGMLNDDTLLLFSGKTSGRVRPYGTVRIKIPCYIPRTGSKRCWLTRCPALITASGCKPLRLEPSTKLGVKRGQRAVQKGFGILELCYNHRFLAPRASYFDGEHDDFASSRWNACEVSFMESLNKTEKINSWCRN